MELFVRKKIIKISASQHISVKNCMNYDHNKNVGLFKFRSGYRKLYLNSPEGYSRKIINAQTAIHVSLKGLFMGPSLSIFTLEAYYYALSRTLTK